MLDYGESGGIKALRDRWSLFDAAFKVEALSLGGSIKISWKVPNTLDVLNWTGRIRILRKTMEWPTSAEDSEAYLIADNFTTLEDTFEIIDNNLTPGVVYYYVLYQHRTDNYWVEDKIYNRDSAYPYSTGKIGEYLYSTLPKGWQITDNMGAKDLYNFLQIFGTLFDNIKEDSDNIRDLASYSKIHADLIPLLDQKINWPTWVSASDTQKRSDSSKAVQLYEYFGTNLGFKNLIQDTTKWAVIVHKGWKRVVFSNGLHGSTTPDTTAPDFIAKLGTAESTTKVTNYSDTWESLNGELFEISDIPGVSGPLSSVMIKRWEELIELASASYLSSKIWLKPLVESESLGLPLDEWEETWYYPETLATPVEDATIYEAVGLTLFISNSSGSITNEFTTKTFHSGMLY